MSQFTGGCLCGAVRYECTAEPQVAGHCQCHDCRRTSGTGHASHMQVPADAVTFAGRAKGHTTPAASGNRVTRHFCGACGAPVYSTNSGFPGTVFLRASSLDDPAHFRPQMVVWTASAPAWDHVDAALPSFPGNPPGLVD